VGFWQNTISQPLSDSFGRISSRTFLLLPVRQSLYVRFEILERDGLARIGRLDIDGKHFSTPAIAFMDTAKHPAPEGHLKLAQTTSLQENGLLVATSEFGIIDEDSKRRAHLGPEFRNSPFAEQPTKGEFSVLEDIGQLLLDSRAFVDRIAETKTGKRLMEPLYASVAGQTHRLAFLVYCGVDVLDSVPLVMAAENGTYLTSSGPLDYSKIKSLPCSCPACRSGMRNKEELLRHNYNAAIDELGLVAHAIQERRLRELVEARVRSDPWLVQNLRLMDLHHFDLQEMHAPVKGPPFHAGSKESLARPDVVRWRKRIEQRYSRPESAKVLLLIPCSAKKPYSVSQSHMRFRDAILASGRESAVHEVVVTSPLGIVPRELELFYPAQDYDIPVTGHWDRDEKKLVEETVSWLVESQGYDTVISHLGDEREPVNSVLKDFVDTSQGEPGSRKSLESLTQALIEHAPERSGSPWAARKLEDMRSLCRFQFGPPGEAICEGASISGRWPNLKIFRGSSQMGMLTGDRGMISLTLDGGEVLAKNNAYCVEIDDFVPKGNLFAVGVEAASNEVRIGDDVAVVHKGDLRAVGSAQMCAAEMALAERGEAVHIRHVAK